MLTYCPMRYLFLDSAWRSTSPTLRLGRRRGAGRPPGLVSGSAAGTTGCLNAGHPSFFQPLQFSSFCRRRIGKPFMLVWRVLEDDPNQSAKEATVKSSQRTENPSRSHAHRHRHPRHPRRNKGWVPPPQISETMRGSEKRKAALGSPS